MAGFGFCIDSFSFYRKLNKKYTLIFKILLGNLENKMMTEK